MVGPLRRSAARRRSGGRRGDLRGGRTLHWPMLASPQRSLLSGDRPATSQMTLGVTDVGPGQPNPFHPHRHAQAEIYYVLSGEGTVSIDGVEHPLRAGTSVFIPGDVWHGARNTGRDTLKLLYVF